VNLGTSLTDIVLTTTVADELRHVADDGRAALLKGPGGIQPRILARPIKGTGTINVPINSSGKVSFPPLRVNSLHRMYTDYGQRRFLIGAFDFEGGQGDKLFYVDESTNTPVTRLMTLNEMTVGSGGEWSFIDFYNVDPDDEDEKYYVIGTNQVGKPFTVSLDSADAPVASLLTVKATDGTDKVLYSVNSLCQYKGSVCYGGFTYGLADGTLISDKSNYLCFSNPGEPDDIAETDNTILDVKVGDSPFEPITKVVTNSTLTDAQGIRGQLVAFTTKRVAIYDGFPPVSNGEEVNFVSVAVGDVGCAAPRTVVQTPAGLCFLGTDGLVYIIPKFSNAGPRPISRAVEQVFKHLTIRQQKQCAATYDDGHYKISVPEVNYSGTEFTVKGGLYPFILPNGNFNASVPNVQYWLDVREPLNPGDIDFGATWSGPHTGMKHSCFAKGTGPEDYNILWAGSAIDGTIYQVSVEGLASDPNPVSPAGTAVPLAYDIQTGQFDAGDIHVDKSVKSFQYGFHVSRALTVTAMLWTSGEVPNSVAGESFTDAFTPVGTLLDGNTTMGDLILAPPNSYRFESNHPATPKRGRTFSFGWYTAPAAGALVKFSDFSFVFEVHKRRE
jgi:hypothetical protein